MSKRSRAPFLQTCGTIARPSDPKSDRTHHIEVTHMERIKATLAGGLVGTLVVGSMLLMNNAIHRLPRLGIGRSLASILGRPDSLLLGWIVFLVLGVVVFSALFA